MIEKYSLFKGIKMSNFVVIYNYTDVHIMFIYFYFVKGELRWGLTLRFIWIIFALFVF